MTLSPIVAFCPSKGQMLIQCVNELALDWSSPGLKPPQGPSIWGEYELARVRAEVAESLH